MSDGKGEFNTLDEIFRKSMEIMRQPLPSTMREASPFEGMLNSPAPDQQPNQKNREPDLLHGLVDDATLKSWLLNEITLLTDLIADDDVSITRGEEKLRALRLRRLRLGKLRQAFETLRDDIEEAEGA